MLTSPSAAHAAYLATRYFPFFDGIRYLLVAVVVADHAGKIWAVLNGGVAVLVFFVMSGFLITTLLCREASRGRLSVLAFFRRRVFRIVPLYYAIIAIYLILIHVTHSLDVADLGSAWRHLTFTSEYTPSRLFGQAWSLGIEEKFYLLWPLVGFVLLRTSRQRAVLAGALLVLLSAFWLRPETHLQHYASIMSGCLLALLLHHERTFRIAERAAVRRGTLGLLVAFFGGRRAVPSRHRAADDRSGPPITNLAARGAGLAATAVRRASLVR